MAQSTSNSLLIDYEGTDLSGKTGAAIRISKILTAAVPLLTQHFGTQIDYLHTREPGGSWGGDIIRTFIKEFWLLAEKAQITPDPESVAAFFTLGREDLYKRVVIPFLREPGNHIMTSDRTWISMLAIQGEYEDGRAGVPLPELEEMASHATSGINPDFVLLRAFNWESFASDVAFRQLFILRANREVMPKDIAPVSDLMRDQRRFEILAKRYEGRIDFIRVDAALDPISSTTQDINIIATRLAEKIPHYPLETVKEIFTTTLQLLESNGLFDEIKQSVYRQELLREVLQKEGLVPNDVMNRFRSTGDMTEIHRIFKLHEEREQRETHLPPSARK